MLIGHFPGLVRAQVRATKQERRSLKNESAEITNLKLEGIIVPLDWNFVIYPGGAGEDEGGCR